MKKISSLLLIIALVFTSLTCISYAAPASDGADEISNTLLEDLGIAINFDDLSSGITRAEFCSLVISAINMGDLTDAHTLPFTDVTESHVYYDAVYDAYALGMISAAELFYPDRIITLNEACKIATTAISYNFLADANGGWPTGYVYAASSKGLLDGVNDVEFTRQSAYTLIYNMLECKLPLMEFTDGEVRYKIDSGTTLLSSMWHLTKLSGTFDGAQYFGGSDGTGVGEGRATVDGNIVKSAGYNTDTFYGEYADVYVEDDGTIRSVYLYPIENKSILTLSSNEILSFKNLTYTYEEDEYTEKTVKITSDATLVINGKPVAYDEKALVPEHGSVKLIRDGSGYGTVIVESYREMVAGAILASEWLLSDVRSSSNIYKRKSAEGLSIYDVHGKAVQFGEISKYSVLWIYESADGLNDQIIVCDDMISGELTGISGTKLEIDNMFYEITDEARKAMDSSMPVGTVLTCSINHEGDIVHVRIAGESTDVRVGYIIFGAITGSGFNQALACQMLGSDGIIKDYKFAKNSMVNGIGLGETADVQFNRYPKDPDEATSIRSGVVAFDTNDDGEIVKVFYGDDATGDFGGSHDMLYMTSSIDATADEYVSYKSTYQYISCKKPTRIFVTPETVQFIVPKITSRNLANDKNYQVKKIADYPAGANMSGYVHTGYSFDKDTVFTSYLSSVFDLASGSSADEFDTRAYLSIVDSVSTVINEDGMPVGKLKIWNAQNKDIEITSDDVKFFSNLGIKKGDLVKVEYNQNKIATDVLLFSYDKVKGFTLKCTKGDDKTGYESDYTLVSPHVVTSNAGMGSLADSFIVAGKVYKVEGNVVQLVEAGSDPAAVDASTILPSYQLSTIKLYKFDSKSESLEPMETTDIRSYLATGSECHTMVVECYSGNILSAYIIE